MLKIYVRERVWAIGPLPQICCLDDVYINVMENNTNIYPFFLLVASSLLICFFSSFSHRWSASLRGVPCSLTLASSQALKNMKKGFKIDSFSHVNSPAAAASTMLANVRHWLPFCQPLLLAASSPSSPPRPLQVRQFWELLIYCWSLFNQMGGDFSFGGFWCSSWTSL